MNRQIQATTSTVGVFKADALRTRMLDINPHAHIDIIYDFVTPENIYSLLGSSPNDSPSEHKMRNKFDCIIDAADKVADKAVSSKFKLNHFN